MRINLISNDNGVGLSQDMRIVKSILKGHTCVIVDLLKHEAILPADINIHFEILNNLNYKSAPVNLFFPNPEWFDFPAMLKGIDLTLCKTRDCEAVFKRLRAKTVFTSFTSEDRYKKFEPVEERVYLHTAGQSGAKGTDTVFKCWKPEYPNIIFSRFNSYNKYLNHNSNLIECFQRLPIEVLIEIQNKSKFHVCPSEYEGFGHYIWEGKSARGIIITTDAPPMSEFVRDGIDGFLVKSFKSRRTKFGRSHFIDPDSFQAVIEKTFELSAEEVEKMRAASRASWEKNDKFFRDKFFKIVESYG